ncbi:hypothetical protein PO883_33940 [Massilia sp. DJPM01]|uniref:hypothetical protein n=1 Tax=Massilia sp. DJPM01 TaxID=3024404 RepID=UPI00259F553B|nr:hypothetical protein [Massilia sp. DJPM01]MDM5182174.1 hypothetical protein [Massilia sp. DJPM01]
MNNDENWLVTVKAAFDEKGAGGGDFYYLLNTMLNEGKMAFPQLVLDASGGIGCNVHEGLSYSLDQDWDDSDFFGEVVFFVGEMESSKLSVGEYIHLIKVASDAYCSHFPIDSEAVARNVARLISRYQK